MTRYLLIFFCLLLSLTINAQKGSPLTVQNLKCGYRVNPLGVEAATPKLSWELVSGQRDVKQTAYRIWVADSPEALNQNRHNIWDSGKIKSIQSIQVAYAGKKQEPTKAYFWKVMTWDNGKNASGWSEPARWQMGLSTQTDWQGAQWISYEEILPSHVIVPAIDNNTHKELGPGRNILPLLRKELTPKSAVKKATLYISGLGHFEASLNGKKKGDHFLDPGWTDYADGALYVTFDVTKELKRARMLWA